MQIYFVFVVDNKSHIDIDTFAEKKRENLKKKNGHITLKISIYSLIKVVF